MRGTMPRSAAQKGHYANRQPANSPYFNKIKSDRELFPHKQTPSWFRCATLPATRCVSNQARFVWCPLRRRHCDGIYWARGANVGDTQPHSLQNKKLRPPDGSTADAGLSARKRISEKRRRFNFATLPRGSRVQTFSFFVAPSFSSFAKKREADSSAAEATEVTPAVFRPAAFSAATDPPAAFSSTS